MKPSSEKHLERFQELIGSEETLPARSHEIVIGEHQEWIVFNLSVEKRRWFTMFVWDPNGHLRVQFLFGKAPNTMVLHKDPVQSSALTLPGDLPAGTYKIEILAVEAKRELEYCLEIESGTGPVPNTGETEPLGDQIWAKAESDAGFSFFEFDWKMRMETGKRWYKGDFHTHTILSDGKMSREAGMLQAEKMGLDFFFTTEHHVMPTAWVSGKALAIPGTEITSSRGHFNILGPKQWIDWRFTAPDGGMETEAGMNRILEEAGKAGALRSINHPMLKPWHWWFNDTKLEQVDVMEIWNDPTYPTNPEATEKALKLWTALWNDGHKIWGIGGSDSHLTPEESYTENGEPSLIGDPGTFVLAEGLSAAEILEGVSLGRAYVSRGPLIEASVHVGSQAFTLGDDLTAALQQNENHRIDMMINIEDISPNASVHWIENGEEVFVQKTEGYRSFLCSFDWNPEEYNWIRIEVRSEEGKLLAFTNPVFSGNRTPSLATWSQLLEKAEVLNIEED